MNLLSVAIGTYRTLQMNIFCTVACQVFDSLYLLLSGLAEQVCFFFLLASFCGPPLPNNSTVSLEVKNVPLATNVLRTSK